MVSATYFTTHGCMALHANIEQIKKKKKNEREMEMAARVKKFGSWIPRPITVG